MKKIFLIMAILFFSSLVVASDHYPPVTGKSITGVSELEPYEDWYQDSVTIELFAKDASSGVKKTEYSYDSNQWNTYIAPITIETQGLSFFYYKSIDNAGNEEQVHKVQLKIDKDLDNDNIYANFEKCDKENYSKSWQDCSIKKKAEKLVEEEKRQEQERKLNGLSDLATAKITIGESSLDLIPLILILVFVLILGEIIIFTGIRKMNQEISETLPKVKHKR